MPKSYTDQEKAYIRRRLKEEAALSMERYGIRKTTVDDLVRKVSIPKGTFYLFYKSKELLLFEVLMDQHAYIEKKLLEAIEALNCENIDCDSITELLFDFYKTASEMPVLRVLNSDEMEILVRKLPEEVVKNHLSHDDKMVDLLFSRVLKSGKNPEVFSAALRGIYFVTLHKAETGEKYYDETLKLLIRGVVMQMLS